MIEQEEHELDEAIKLADSSRDDSLPFLVDAKDLLLAKSVAVEKIQRDFEAKIGRPKGTAGRSYVGDTEEAYFFYQSTPSQDSYLGPKSLSLVDLAGCDGQLYFLHPIDVKWLVVEYGTHSMFPLKLIGKIIDIEDSSQTEVRLQLSLGFLLGI